MHSVHYQVEGLINTPVKTQVKNVLEKLDGVQKVNVDLHRSSVEVDYNSPAKESEIRAGIEQAGCWIKQ